LEEEEKKPKPEEEEGVEELMDKMYKLMADWGKTLEKLATYISGSSEAQRGLTEAVGKMNEKIDALAGEVQKLSVSLSEVFSEHKKGKYTEAKLGEGEASGVGEKVTVGNVREPGADMLKGEVVKTVSTPSPVVANTKKLEESASSDVNEVIKGILAGKFKAGEYGSKVWEVIRR
jgi:DNA repair exonuclease SbcCD ATPase subunit